MNDKHVEKQVMDILRKLSANAGKIKAGIAANNLGEPVKLTGERVALIEALRELGEAKVSLAGSDIKDEMNLVMKNIENDTFEAIGGISARLSSLLSELAKIRGAKEIAAYAATRHPAYRISAVDER